MPAANPVLIQDIPRSRNESPPVFLIHDASGLLTSYFKVGTLGRKVYGIWDPKFDADGIGGWQSVKEIAEAYIRLIKRVMLRGEIVLGGWSFGGVLAVQIAHMLAMSGRGLRVSRIILIDSVYPRCPRPEAQKEPAKLHHAPALPGINQETRDKLMTALMRATCLSDQWDPPSWALPRTGVLGTARSRDVDPTPPHAVLIRAKDLVPMADPAEKCPLDRTRFLPQLGWEDMLEGFVEQVIETTGNHYSVFDSEHIDTITSHIRKSLDMNLG
ncbi:thioesterase [Colletotrichum lupini]|uniref:Thioesterase n=3 Tax=Colletotrichum acutatum species complex TaxID=2707335 RepID=A0A9Q8WHU0_9PEZI|nr:thioesterase [Colletotrichum lupini]KAK0381111.1 thioesterase [Colletotrichum limetticola]KAK1469875.1 thioesterase [Colletotrichum melonis]UQC84173.1 thioesterase [Colletotrichum lupini]